MNQDGFHVVIRQQALSSLASLENRALRQSFPVAGVAGVKGKGERGRKEEDKFKVVTKTPSSLGPAGSLLKGRREPPGRDWEVAGRWASYLPASFGLLSFVGKADLVVREFSCPAGQVTPPTPRRGSLRGPLG